MKKIIIALIVIVLVVFFFPKSYISSPGLVTREMNEAFNRTKPTCLGYSYLTNAELVAVDAPGNSLCFGWLKK